MFLYIVIKLCSTNYFNFWNHPKIMSDGRELVDYGIDVMGIDVEKWIALQAVHGIVHRAFNKMKYTWFGVGYLSNMYFKFIANHPTYQTYMNGVGQTGGDLSFGQRCNTVGKLAVGDADGNPMKMSGW